MGKMYVYLYRTLIFDIIYLRESEHERFQEQQAKFRRTRHKNLQIHNLKDIRSHRNLSQKHRLRITIQIHHHQ